MLNIFHQPFYDPEKTYAENFKDGPFAAFADGEVFENNVEPIYDFFREKVFLPFGIPGCHPESCVTTSCETRLV